MKVLKQVMNNPKEEDLVEVTLDELQKMLQPSQASAPSLPAPKLQRYNFDNSFYLYDDINVNSMFALGTFLKERLNEWNQFLHINSEIIKNAKPNPIKIYIQSNGGDLFAVMPVVDLINSYKDKLEIHTHVEGIAASAATLISVVGHNRTITRNSYLLIHELRSQVAGTYSNIKDENENCDKIMKSISELYLNKSNGQISEEELNETLKHDWLLTAEECLKYGFVDHIIG